MLIDTHAHLQDKAFRDDWAAALDRAQEAGVQRVLLPGSSLADSQQAQLLAAQDSRLCHAVGCHPHEASSFFDATVIALEGLLQPGLSPQPVAVGEIGLDYHYDFSPRQKQQRVFWQQIELAHRYRLPIIVHSREATADTLRILNAAREEGWLSCRPGVFHCYSGSRETAKLLLDMGFYLGFDGPITFKNAKKALRVIAVCPRDRLVLETDSPYLSPAPYRGKRNEPARLPLIAEKVAAVWDLPVAEVMRQTSENACRLFSLSLE